MDPSLRRVRTHRPEEGKKEMAVMARTTVVRKRRLRACVCVCVFWSGGRPRGGWRLLPRPFPPHDPKVLAEHSAGVVYAPAITTFFTLFLSNKGLFSFFPFDSPSLSSHRLRMSRRGNNRTHGTFLSSRSLTATPPKSPKL